MRSRRALLFWGAAVVYGAAIFILSSQPVPAPGERVVSLVGDKVLHAAEYAGFAFLLALAISSSSWPRLSPWAAGIALAAAVLYAASDEFHQTLVPGRDGNVTDFAADALGAVLGAALVRVWRWRATRVAPVSGTSPR